MTEAAAGFLQPDCNNVRPVFLGDEPHNGCGGLGGDPC